jgi:Tfp pilus assembly PilM family ATPase
MLNRAQTCLFVQWTRPLCRYLLVERCSQAPRIQAVGSFEADEDQPLVDQLQEELAAQEIRCRQAVLLLPRAELEVSSHQLPPAAKDELPELVGSAVASEFDDAAGTHVTDFLVTQQDETGCEAIAFSLSDQRISDFKSSFKTAGLKLLGITFTGLGGVELLQQVKQHLSSPAVVIAVSDGDIDLAVVEDHRPILFRSIPRSAEEDRVRAERLGAEIGRTLALTHRADADSTRLYLLGDVGEHEQLAQLLSEQRAVSASVVSPLQHLESAVDVDPPSRYANLLGVACAWNGARLTLDLLNPRRAPQKAGPGRRVAFWGGIAAMLCLAIGYLAWQDRAEQLTAISKQEGKLTTLAKRANKAQGLKDVANAVQAWRSDDIAWLDELRELSERLPSGDQALIRRMSMSTDSQGNGVIDLAVQVSQPGVVANLEDAVRDERHSVSSKRVTESDEKAKLPWTFETRIAFTPSELPDLSLPDDIAESSRSRETSDRSEGGQSLPTSTTSIAAQPDAQEGGARE